MSLDVYLIQPATECNCPTCGTKYTPAEPETLYHANITHNLGKMAESAGIYKALWRPEEIHATRAHDITPILEKGLADLKARPNYFEQFNSPNGWGMYEHFVPFVEKYLSACKENRTAEIKVSR